MIREPGCSMPNNSMARLRSGPSVSAPESVWACLSTAWGATVWRRTQRPRCPKCTMDTMTPNRAIVALSVVLAVACSNDNQTPTPAPAVTLTVASGGNNVPERYSSDLWVTGAYAYTGTWGIQPRGTNAGDVLKIWSLDGSGAPTLVDSITTSGIDNVSDVQVSQDGTL